MEDVVTPTNSSSDLNWVPSDTPDDWSVTPLHNPIHVTTRTDRTLTFTEEPVLSEQTTTQEEPDFPEVTILHYPPPHPEARGVGATTPMAPYKVPVTPPTKRHDMLQQNVRNRSHSDSSSPRPKSTNGTYTTPIIVSAPPPRQQSLSNQSSGSSCSIQQDLDEVDSSSGNTRRTVRVNFQVSVDKSLIREGEEVRITGNVTSLGKWDVYQSVSLVRNTELEDIWSQEFDVPAELPIKYRYLIAERISGRGSETTNGDMFRVISWETFLDPRRCTFKRPRSANDQVLHTQRGEYGVNLGDQTLTDDGWLVGTSELHVQLGLQGRAIAIETLPMETQYLLRMQSFCTKSKQKVFCSPLKTKLLSRSSGNCLTFDLGEGACPYNQDNNLVIFTAQSPDFTDCGFTIDLYAVDPNSRDHSKDAPPNSRDHSKDAPPNSSDPSKDAPPVSIPPDATRVGRASLLPQQFMAHPDVTQGQVTLTVFSLELLPVGTITLSYLLIHPIKESPLVHSTKHSYSNYWKKHKRMLHIGHRGLGDSYHLHGDLKPTVTENTISSLKMAGNHGADYVEFDVQLTKDLVPIVYHNFQVCTTLAREGFFSGELYQMEVKDLGLHQLQSLKLDHSSVLEKLGPPDRGNSSSASDSYDFDSPNETYWGVKRGTSYRENLPERKTFPTLKKLFQSLPNHIGFNIEVKYPVPERDKDGKVVENYSSFDLNLMADIILKMVYRHARGRKVMFSCFNPDMCTVLRRKQPKYPVMFLTCSLNPIYNLPVDVRGHSLHDAMMHARAEKLLGIVSNSTILLNHPHMVKTVKERQLVLFTWGHENNDVKNIDIQNKAGVDAVIYDCIINLLPGPQKNVFQLEEEEERKKTLSYWQGRKEEQDSDKLDN